jgi:DNA-binding PadR family transcriptional regulator
MPNTIKELTPAGFHILLSLGDAPQHGYAIIQEVKKNTAGRVKLGPGTLYTTIKRLLETGLIEETTTRPEDDDERRRYYQLTPTGRRVAQQEAEHLERVVNQARAVRLLKGPA